jgi:GT2 family glycosyltransferase
MKRTLILVNTLNAVSAQVYGNHMAFISRTIRDFPEKNQIVFMNPPRMSIDNARNRAAKHALEMDCDYLLFIDDDVLVPPDTLSRLLKHEKDIIAGLVVIRGYPFNVMAFKRTYDKKKISKSWDGGLTFYNDLPVDKRYKDKRLKPLIPVAAVGFSCALIHTDVLKALEPPYFVTGQYHTEDVYFCVRAATELTPAPSIFMDTTLRCGHLMNPEYVSWNTRDKFREFYGETEKIKAKLDYRSLKMIENSLKAF